MEEWLAGEPEQQVESSHVELQMLSGQHNLERQHSLNSQSLPPAWPHLPQSTQTVPHPRDTSSLGCFSEFWSFRRTPRFSFWNRLQFPFTCVLSSALAPPHLTTQFCRRTFQLSEEHRILSHMFVRILLGLWYYKLRNKTFLASKLREPFQETGNLATSRSSKWFFIYTELEHASLGTSSSNNGILSKTWKELEIDFTQSR